MLLAIVLQLSRNANYYVRFVSVDCACVRGADDDLVVGFTSLRNSACRARDVLAFYKMIIM